MLDKQILSMKKKLLIFLAILFSFFVLYKYLYKDHRDIKKEQARYIVKSIDFSNEFSINSVVATTKYIDKTIQISGKITQIADDYITINENIICYFNKTMIHRVLLNSEVIIKGRCIGFDELLEEIKLDECSIIN